MNDIFLKGEETDKPEETSDKKHHLTCRDIHSKAKPKKQKMRMQFPRCICMKEKKKHNQ
jgi:hypothetical protein